MQKVKFELARKLLHLTLGGTFIALAVVSDSNKAVAVIALALFFIFIFFRRLNILIFPPAYNVQRISFGEIFFALGALMAVLLADNLSVFIASMAVLALADPAGAYMGIKFPSWFKVKRGLFDFKLLSTITFTAVTFLVLFASNLLLFDNNLSLSVLIAISLLTALTETLTPYGGDNTTIPVIVCLALNVVV